MNFLEIFILTGEVLSSIIIWIVLIMVLFTLITHDKKKDDRKNKRKDIQG